MVSTKPRRPTFGTPHLTLERDGVIAWLTSIEVAAERDMVLADNRDGFLHHGNPVIGCEQNVVRHIQAHHWKLRGYLAVDFFYAELLFAIGNFSGIPEWLACVFCPFASSDWVA